MTASALHITVELPGEVAQSEGETTESLSQELRLLWILDRVRSGRISVGKGAELASLNRWSFLRIMDEHGVPAIATADDELERELVTLQSL